MSRTLGTNLQANAEAAFSSEVTLVQITIGGANTYIADGADSSGNAISWNSQTWNLASFAVENMEWAESGIPNRFTLRISTADKTLMATLRAADKDDTVAVYQTASLSSYAGADDVVKIADGSLGAGFTQSERYISFFVMPIVKVFPPWVVNAAEGFTQISAPGTYALPNGTVTIVRER